MNLLRYLILPLCLLLATGCQQYAAAPIDLTAHSRRVGSRDIITAKVTGYAEQMFARRSGAMTYDPSHGLSLAEAEVVALFFNPQLRLARLRANVARVGAAEAGRWQDPELAVDGERIIESAQNPWVLFGSLSLTLPLSPPLRETSW
jgi:outer membrane protein, heavy metal efflux system